MMKQKHRITKIRGSKRCEAILVAVMFAALVITGLSLAEDANQLKFASPEEAVKAMVAALNSNDTPALEAIFGSGSADLISAGDPTANQLERERFLKLYGEKSRLEQTADKVVLSIGNEDWPFPIPIVKEGDLWRFDTEEGRDEILARRIGHNELNAIQVCLAYVDAQREYAFKDRDADGNLQYAQKIRSDEGMKTGLYWEAKAGEDQSPLGPLFAAAHEKGYSLESSNDQPIPYYGYYYRILEGQGRDAPGGAYDYLVNGKMIGGFALVAYPAAYASSGIMTFIVNHDGTVYQKDLGPNTEKAAQAIELFDPDSTWKKAEEKDIRTKGKASG
ncbi:MAG: DUF2950 domain-containing protein [Desulfobacterales bacterium]